MNVWVNPTYWPFAFFDKQVAAEVSSVVAFVCYALACYGMARCFDLPRLPSITAAQLSLMLFGPAALAVGFAVVYVSIPGLSVVYAPHMLAFGLLARLSPQRPQVFLIGTAVVALLFYSLYCDPLWTLVSGIAWIVPFAVVTFSPLRRDTMLVRCAVLGGSLAVLLLSGALEYAYSLSQYTARVQFSDLLRRPPDAVFALAFVSSKYAKYFYYACVLGWAIGVGLLRGRPRTLVLAASISAGALLAYAAAFLSLCGNWPLPLPFYLEHALFPLFWTAGVAGYWGGLQKLIARGGLPLGVSSGPGDSFAPHPNPLPASGERERAASGARFALYPRPLPARAEREPADSALPLGLNPIGNRFSAWRLRLPALSSKQAAAMTAIIAMGAALIIPAVAIDTVVKFRPWSGDGNFPLLFKTLRALGVRYVAGYERFAVAEAAQLPSTTFPRRPLAGPPGGWLVYQLPDVNVGNYSPTGIVTAESGAEILNNLRSSTFDYWDQVVLSTAISETLTPARNVRMSIVRGGLHVSAQSDGTSLLLLPQQFSHCLRAHDDRVQLVRADLLLTGMFFSGRVDTDISFDYGILSPPCRRADFADLKQLQIKLPSP